MNISVGFKYTSQKTIDSFFEETPKVSPEVPSSGESGCTLSPLRPTMTMDEARELISSFDNQKSTEISITFKPEIHDAWQPDTLREITERTIRRCLGVRRAPAGARLILIGEFSPLGRWHYHGMFSGIPGDMVSKLKRACVRHLGRTEIKQLKYPDSFKTYMMESYVHTMTGFGNYKKEILLQKWEKDLHIYFETI